jgi:hypothetical protein
MAAEEKTRQNEGGRRLRVTEDRKQHKAEIGTRQDVSEGRKLQMMA